MWVGFESLKARTSDLCRPDDWFEVRTLWFHAEPSFHLVLVTATPQGLLGPVFLYSIFLFKVFKVCQGCAGFRVGTNVGHSAASSCTTDWTSTISMASLPRSWEEWREKLALSAASLWGISHTRTSQPDKNSNKKQSRFCIINCADWDP